MSRRPAAVLVVSATRAEAAHVPTGVEVLITGVGKVPAATAVASRLAVQSPTEPLEVLNIGTAGALRPDLYGLFLPDRVVNHDFSSHAIRALGFEVQDTVHLQRAESDEVVLATGDSFVTDPVVRDELAGRAHLVDMEGYAVAWACQQAGVPVQLVKHVSDNADETALDWVAAVDASARILGAWVDDYLAGSARGTGGPTAGDADEGLSEVVVPLA